MEKSKKVLILLLILVVLICSYLIYIEVQKGTRDSEITSIEEVEEKSTPDHIEEEEEPEGIIDTLGGVPSEPEPPKVVNTGEEGSIFVEKPIRRVQDDLVGKDNVEQRIYEVGEIVKVIEIYDPTQDADIYYNNRDELKKLEREERAARNLGLNDAYLDIAYISDSKGESLDFFSKGVGAVIVPWSTFSPDSLNELVKWQTIYNKYKDEVSFIFLNRGFKVETLESVQPYLDERKLTIPIYFDSELTFFQANNIESLPVAIFVNSDGYIVTRHEGSMTEEQIKQELKRFKTK